MTDSSARPLMLCTAAIGALFIAASALLFPAALTGGVIAGALIGFVNIGFWVLVVKRMLGLGESHRVGMAVRIALKYGLTGALILGALLLFDVDPRGFAIGIGDMVLGPLLAGLWVSRLPGDDTPA